MFDYPVTLTPDGETWLVTFVDVPEAITFGSDEKEALRKAVMAQQSALEAREEGMKSGLFTRSEEHTSELQSH